MSTPSIPQGTLLWPRQPFAFKANGKPVQAHCGQSFWVCNSQLNQQATGVIQLARSGRNAGSAWNFEAAQVATLFTDGKKADISVAS